MIDSLTPPLPALTAWRTNESKLLVLLMDTCPYPSWHLTKCTVLSDKGLKPSLIVMTYLKHLINNSVKLSLGEESPWSVQGEETEGDKTVLLYK